MMRVVMVRSWNSRPLETRLLSGASAAWVGGFSPYGEWWIRDYLVLACLGARIGRLHQSGFSLVGCQSRDCSPEWSPGCWLPMLVAPTIRVPVPRAEDGDAA